jgi:rhodanese-related sulfurtransferase
MKTVELPPVIGATELQQAMTKDRRIRLLDVRMPGEFEGGHIAGSYNVPLSTLGEHAAELTSVGDPVVLVCRGGNRARQAEQVLRSSGMTRLHVLEGGVAAWQEQGYDLRRTGRERWALDRQVRLVAGLIVLTGVLLSVFVSPGFVWLAGFMGAGLTFSAVADWCGLALLLGRLPYNRGASCDVSAMVQAIRAGEPGLAR